MPFQSRAERPSFETRKVATITEFDPPFKRSGTKKLFHDASGIDRVGIDALDKAEQLGTELLVEVARLAGRRARADERTTLLDRDVEEAFAEVLSRGDQKVPLNPQKFFDALQTMDTDKIVNLIRIVTDWVQQQEEQGRKLHA